MMKTICDISPFVRLGDELRCELDGGALDPVIARSVAENRWFTPETVSRSIRAICSDMLTAGALTPWLERYPLPAEFVPRSVAVIMAGNIPLVGFSDLLGVLAAGHRCLVKPSSKDRVLMEHVVGLLKRIDDRIPVETLDDTVPDALIATGSDSTRLRFESLYPGVPALLRGSRNSIAVLTGDEDEEQLHGLADDVFSYFGLGCRNVSLIFVPENYDLPHLSEVFSACPVSHTGYLNNYRQAKAVLRMNSAAFVDGGFFVLRGGDRPPGNVSEIVCRRYRSLDEVEQWIAQNDDRLQCIVSSIVAHPRSTDFGRAQHPSLHDYPDGVDVIDFLRRI